MATPPRIWLLIGDKPGDNAQARVVADALGWPYEVRQVFPKAEWVLGKPKFEPGLDHLDMTRSAPLAPPWPDLIVTVGRRPSAAALWVQDQSGGRSRIVLLGRPKRWAERFALIIAPRQFKIPPRDNLVQLDLPLLRADPAAVAAAGEAWRERLSGLARPLTAVLIGGETKPFRFDAAVARDLLAELARIRTRDGGTLYLTTSRRTRPDVVAALEASLPRRRAALSLVDRNLDRQSLSGPAGPRRPVRRHRRQHLDDGRGREPGPPARDLPAAPGPQPARPSAHEPRQAEPARPASPIACTPGARRLRPRPRRDPARPRSSGASRCRWAPRSAARARACRTSWRRWRARIRDLVARGSARA